MATIDTTIRCDSEGRVALTAEQAEAFARWYLADPGEEDPADEGILRAAGLHGHIAATGSKWLARWVLRWAPVVRAADALSPPPSIDAEIGAGQVWDAIAAVRAARGEGAAING